MRTLVTGLLFIAVTTPAIADDWAANWLQDSLNAAGAEPTYYQGANRNYLSMGNISYRTTNSVDYPLTISPPRLKTMGCGGIDMFMGGISYMDLDMLVDKFEQMIQNGEVIAFQLAIKALSEKLGATVESIESVIDKVNNIQLDSCAMAKAAVTTVYDGGTASDAMGEVWSEISQGQDLSLDAFKNPTQRASSIAENNNQAPSTTDISKEISACPAVVKRELLVEGSALKQITEDYGMGSYVDVFRGYIGDIYITHTGDGGIPTIGKVSPCLENDSTSSDDFVYGTSLSRPEPEAGTLEGECFRDPDAINLMQVTADHIDDLIDALKNPSHPISEFDGLQEWLNASPLPVYGIMQEAVHMGIEQEVSLELQNMLAYAYAYQMFDDMYKISAKAMQDLKGAFASSSFDEEEAASASDPKCNLKPYLHVIKAYEMWTDSIKKQHATVRQQYHMQLKALQTRLEIVTRYQDVSDRNSKNNLGAMPK